jgi:glycosyltransferase involved in cell wall biosynthesis
MAQYFDLGPKLHVITNGYDPEELRGVQPNKFGHRAIVYTGTFYPPKRVVTPVLAALKRLNAIRNGYHAKWYFHYYGDGEGEAHVRQEGNRLDVMEQIVLHGMVSRTEALSAVRGADVAVVVTSIFDNASLEDQGTVTGKLFEPLGLGTPILLIAPPGSDAIEIVEKTRGGRSFIGVDIEGMVGFLSSIERADKKQSNCTDKYSWPSLAMKLDRTLKAVIADKANVTR